MGGWRWWPATVVLAGLVAALPGGRLVPAAAQTVAGSPGPVLPASQGYWAVGADGGVFGLGGAGFYGSTGAVRLNRPIVGMAPSRSGRGYWLVASDGGVFAFGDAAFRGSTGAIRLNRPIVGMAATPSGAGYWLVASDGGVFAFGDAVFRGSTGAVRLNSPVVAMAPTPSGSGYWLAAADGGVFAFGDAVFRGSTGGLRLVRPVVGLAPTPSGRGYWLAAYDGGVFAFGDAPFRGSPVASGAPRSVAGIAATRRGLGYWLVSADGAVDGFGDAVALDNSVGSRGTPAVVGISAAPVRTRPETAVFFYPWYARPDLDFVWRHWEANRHSPPDDVAANFYPSRGAYSSSDPAVLDAQMAELAAAGVDVVVTSWWGRGSFEDESCRPWRPPRRREACGWLCTSSRTPAERWSASSRTSPIGHRPDGDALRRVVYTESHDEVANGHARMPEEIAPGDAAGVYAQKRSTLGAALVMTSPGIPMIFQGQEILEDQWFRDTDPVDWSKAVTHAGILALYRDLIRLRRNWHGTTAGLRGNHVNVHHVNDDDNVVAFHRWHRGGPGDDVVVVVNVSDRRRDSYRIGFPRPGRWRVRCHTDWAGYSPLFDDHFSFDTDADGRPQDGMAQSADIGIGRYAAVILSQDG